MEEEKAAKENKEHKGVSHSERKKHLKTKEEPFPPRRKWWQWIVLFVSTIAFVCAVLYLIEQFCSVHSRSWVTERFELLQEFSSLYLFLY